MLPPMNRKPHHVVMFAYPDAQILDVTGPLEIFGRAARWLRDKEITPDLAYTVEIVAREAGPIRTSSGIRLIAERAFREVKSADTLLVTGGVGFREAMQDAAAIAWIKRMAKRTKRVGSICTGAMVLAQTGLLDGKRATTHWAYCDEFAATSEVEQVCADMIFVRDGNVFTSAGVTTGMDMALAMVEEDWGQPVALAVAQELVMYLKRPGGQSQFSRQLAAQFSDNDRLRDLQLWMLEHLDEDLSVPALARRSAMSERNFARRFVEAVGLAPGKYVEQARVDAARRKLEQTDLDVARIAARCGFGSAETMRRVFIKHLAIPPSEYRDRFRSANGEEVQ
jgi:transcriptional regulator GlxA family with amidase domain